MTNGEKMQEAFPEGKTRKCRDGVVFESDGWCHANDSDWWSAEYKEPRKGHWIADVDRWGDLVTTVNGYRCDKCNTFNADKDNYCPNCGADMRGEE